MKFKELKNKFYSEFKKVELSTRSGAGSDETYVPEFVHYEKLYFLKKTYETDEVISFGNLHDHTFNQFFDESYSESRNPLKRKSSSQNWKQMSRNSEESDSESYHQRKSKPLSQTCTPMSKNSNSDNNITETQNYNANYTPKPPRSRIKKNKENRSEELLTDAFKTLKQVQERNMVNANPQQDIDPVDACASLVKYTIQNKIPEERAAAVNKLLQFLTTL